MSELITVKMLGVIKDIEPSDLDDPVYTDSNNMYFDDGKALKSKGYTQVFGALSIAPLKLQPMLTSTSSYWMYAGLSAIYVTDGVTHSDITPASGATGTTLANRWNKAYLNGVPILNNKINPPIWWDGVVANVMTDITGWVTGDKCDIIRSYKNYLFALNVEESGIRYNNKLKWSSAADPGTLPVTWVPAATNDAGSTTLSENPSEIVDGLPLRDEFIIYKSSSVHRCQYIGGRYVFKFREIFSGSFGALSEGCVVEFDNKHAVLTSNDFIIHDGNTFASKIDFKMRKWLFKQINNDYIDTCFLAIDYTANEIYICYPSGSSTIPNKKLTYNYREDFFYPGTLPDTYHIENGVVVPTSIDDSWDGDLNSWNSDATLWDQKLYSATNDSVLIAAYTDIKLYHQDDTSTFDGVDFSSYVERQTFEIKGDANNKLIDELWPNLIGAIGKEVTIRVGSQKVPNDPIAWGAAQTFTIGSQNKIDFFAEGRYFSFRFSSDDEFTWGLVDFQINVSQGGRF